MQTWLLLIVSVPPEPSSLRVRIWRKLQALGAVALKNSVYLLPFTPENYEQFQWLPQEGPNSGGEGGPPPRGRRGPGGPRARPRRGAGGGGPASPGSSSG